MTTPVMSPQTSVIPRVVIRFFLPVAFLILVAARLDAEAVALKEANTMEAEFRVGAAGKVAVGFQFAGGKMQTLLGVVKPDALKRTVEKEGKKTPETVPMPDGWIEFTGAGLRCEYHSRPRLVRYTEAQQADLAKEWETLPAASQCWVPMELRADATGAELWLDGRYSGRVEGGGRLTEVRFKMEEGGAVRGVRTFTRVDTGMYLPLDVRRIARPGVMGVMGGATVSLKPGMQQVGGSPMIVVDGAGNADVGAARMMQGPRALETNEFTSRTSLDGMRESLHFSVPQAFYHRAWVLCAVEADLGKEAVLTTRLTRFGTQGRGGAIADTTLTLPRGGEALGEGVARVGTVEYPTADKGRIEVPLYLVRVDLKVGEIADLIADTKDPYAAMKIGPYLDFEFLGKMGRLEVQIDRRRMPVAGSTSAVHVFGATLEKSPVELRFKQSQPGNIFHNDEKPETTVNLRAVQRTGCVLRWDVVDVEGRVLASREKAVTLDAPGAEADVVLPLTMPEPGWYGLRIRVEDGRGGVLMKHDAAFALLGRDTRTAGYESPYGTWWFNGVHYSTREAAVAGPLLHKAGMRRSTFGWTQDSEAELAPWMVSLNQVKWQFRLADLQDWPGAEARAEKGITEMLKRFPHCQFVDLFHESYDPGAYPPELYGEKYVAKDEALGKREDELYELGLRAAKFLRAKFPQLKIMAGNSGGSLGMIAVLLRRGFPRELVDYLGNEATGQTIAPEKLTPHTTGGIWLMDETARRLGYDIPLAGCFEFTSRAERDLGRQRVAEWYARDMMIGLAHRFPTVSPAGLEDVGNAYYDALWGASGLCERSPLHYPKPAYVALATLTKALDSVTLARQFDTGSSGVHALEFKRGSEWVYAVWTERGDCELQVELTADSALTLTGFYGGQRAQASQGGLLAVTASSAVSYFTSRAPVKAITAGARRFPLQSPPAGTQVVARMDRATDWELAPEDTPLTTKVRVPGKFTLRQENDAERGACIEVALQREGDLPPVVAEYTALKLKEPAPIPGRPHSIGMWVRGDSSWGRIMWEIEDAKGERFRSSGGYDGGDWGNLSALDFDGWCFITFPLTNESPLVQVEPGFGAGQWVSKGDGRLDYPLKLTGIYVITHRQSLDLTKMVKVRTPLRFRDVSVVEGGDAGGVR